MTHEPTTAPTVEEMFERRLRAARWLCKQGFGIVLLPAPIPGDCGCPPGSTTRKDPTTKGLCKSPGKHPLGQDWEHHAAHTPPEVSGLVDKASLRALRQFGAFPEPGSGKVVIDEDVPGYLADLAERENLTVPVTFGVRTSVDDVSGQRKQHLYLRLPAGTDETTLPRKFGGGDIRVGGSGQVVGPWSSHASGVVYEPFGPPEITELSGEWVEVLRRDSQRQNRANDAAVAPTDDGWVVAKGARWPFLVRKSVLLRKGGLRNPDLETLVTKINAQRCQPPHKASEITRLCAYVDEKVEEPPPDFILNVPGTPGFGEEAPVTGLRVVVTSPIADFAPDRANDFPTDPSEVAFDGIAGLVAGDLAWHSTASRVGLLMSTLVYWGGLFGDRFDLYESQPTNIFAVLVGDTARGRKGTATRNVWTAMQKALDSGMTGIDRYQWGGLASGQALLRQMQDAGEIKRGVSIEEEFETVLRGARSTRDYNSILNTIINKAWDGRLILHTTAAKTTSFRVEPPYNVGVLGNITREVLRTLLPPEMIAGGFANRLLWVPVRGTDRPIDVTRPVALTHEIAVALSEARDWRLDAKYRTPIFTTPAGDLVQDYFEYLEGVGGAYAKFTPRLHVMAARIAMVHALMDQSPAVTPEYIERGIALTEYCRSALLWTFSDETGDDRVDYVIDVLRTRPEGITAREFAQVYKDPGVQKRVRRLAEQAGLIQIKTILPDIGSAGGRPKKVMTLSDWAGAGLVPRFVVLPRARGGETPTEAPVVEEMEVGEEEIKPNQPPPIPISTTVLPTTLTHKLVCHFYSDHQSKHFRADCGSFHCSICSVEGECPPEEAG